MLHATNVGAEIREVSCFHDGCTAEAFSAIGSVRRGELQDSGLGPVPGGARRRHEIKGHCQSQIE